MKKRGLPVSIGYSLESDAINIVHCQVARSLLKASDLRSVFIISIRADFRPFPYGQFEVVQNERYATGRRIYMPLFPQPGLIPRDENRDQVVNICYSGRMQNCIDADRLESDLSQIGCRFVFKSEGLWQDMSDVDVLLGIRTFSKEPHHSKPPTKLFNAWLSGIPFIGGYDSAYEQVGHPGVNYLRVSSYSELIDMIVRLKADSALYSRLVEAGKTVGERYTPDQITDMWLGFFQEKVALQYACWRNKSQRVRIASSIKSVQFLMDKIICGLAT
jgi:hypothetical protein